MTRSDESSRVGLAWRMGRRFHSVQVRALCLGLVVLLGLGADWLVAESFGAAAVVGGFDEGEPVYRVGVARREVTPEYPIRLNGFGGRRAESEGVSQPIWAKALAISSVGEDATPVVLITLDSLGVRTSLVDQVAEELRQSYGLPRDHLIVTFTHSHCTPKLNGSSDTIFSTPIPEEHQAHIDRYTAEMKAHLVAVAGEAIESREPARLRWSSGTVEFAMNRRTPGGPVDHTLPVLGVYSAAGELRAVYTTYACHCVTLSFNQIHGDWAGCAQELIERRYPGVTAMVSIGCGSDSNPSSGVTGDQVAIAVEQGQQIANEVARLLAGEGGVELRGELHVESAELELEFQPLPSEAQLEELAKQASPAGYNASWQLARLRREGRLPESLAYPIQTLRFGDEMAMVFLAGEVCVDYALRLRRELLPERLWLHGYSNDFGAYIPSERLLVEGGYGGGAEVVYFALPAMLAAGLEDKIIAEVVRQLPETWRIEPGTQGVAPRDPEGALREFRLDDRWRIECVASEPQVEDPVAIDFSADGKLWVAEMPDYGRAVDAEFEQTGRVKWLEDRDGDGVFETAHVFASGLRFPTDVKAWRDGVLICDAPRVLYAEDTTGDGVADRIETWLEGFATHNPHARVNSLRWDLDGWLQGSGGLFGGVITTRSGKTVDVRGRDFRWHPDSDRLEAATGTSQQGRVRNDWGRWFGCDNGTLIREYPIRERDIRRNGLVSSPPAAVSPLVGVDPGQLFPAGELVLFKLSGQGGRPTSACGLGFYRDRLLGDDVRGDSFTCEPVNQLVHRRDHRWVDGAWQAVREVGEEDREFLSSVDRWFRPVQARTGPDGGLWIVDMYRYVIEHSRWIPEETKADLDIFAGKRRGRIYRVVPAGESRGATWGFDVDDADELLGALASSNGTVRDLADQWLVWNDRRDLVKRVGELAMTAEEPAVQVQAIALLGRWDAVDERALSRWLDSPDVWVRAEAVAASESLLMSGRGVEQVLAGLDDSDAAVRRQALTTLGLIADERVVRELAGRWPSVQGDVYERGALLAGIHEGTRGLWRKVLGAELLGGTEESGRVGGVWSDAELQRSLWHGMTTEEWSAAVTQALSWGGEKRDVERDVIGLAIVEARPAGFEFAEFGEELQELVRSREEELWGTMSVGDETSVELKRANLAWLRGLELLKAGEVDAWLSLIDFQQPDEVQRGAVEALVARGDRGAWLELLGRLDQVTPGLQEWALEQWWSRARGRDWLIEILGERGEVATWLSRDQQRRWLESASESQREKLVELLQVPARPQREQVLASYRAALVEEGSVARGQALFTQHCAACHRLGTAGGGLGPDLNALGNKDPQSLLISVLDPSRDIDARYRSVAIQTTDGRALAGLVLEETGTTLKLQLTADESVVVRRDEVEQLQASPKSFMPEGFEQQISVESMPDLVAYLLKTGPLPKSLEGNSPQLVAWAAGSKSVDLKAETAEIRGESITFETTFGNVGYWHGADDYLVWQFESERARRVEVFLEYACDPGSAGNRLELIHGSERLEVEIPATEGWSDYQLVRVGELEIAAGRQQLSLIPGGQPRGAVCDLGRVRLIELGSGDR